MPPHKPQQATAEARSLLRTAERDLKTVEVLLQHPDAPISSICFHAQQYLEKVIKAVLVSNAVIFRRTHNLEKLADLLAQKDIEPPLHKDLLKRLNPFAVTTRYEDIEIALIDIQTVAEMIEKTREWIIEQLYE
ncbi:MAG: HEPN domain-containing protein [Candidatus Latescibacter sp.]|nr:HEPN domain-containing protein [Candidatus Latescibacter sp.]